VRSLRVGALLVLVTAPLVACTGAAAPARPSTSAVAATVPATRTATAAPRSPGRRGFTIAATGTVLVHMPVARRALRDGRGRQHDFRRMLARIKPLVAAADLGICHVETPLTRNDREVRGYPMFNSPHELADAYAWAGYDTCSTASNHALDRGKAGIEATLGALDAAGLGHTGTARTVDEAAAIPLRRVAAGAAVAHLSYSYGFNGLPLPAGRSWAANTLDVRRVLADARRARAAGADFVVLSLHWGQEYRSAPTPRQRSQARELVASADVDLVLGDHVHVQQPVERIGGKYVVYGMGNLLSNQSPAAGLPARTQDGAVVTVHVAATSGGGWAAERVVVTPTYCQVGPYTVWPVGRALADPATPAALRPALAASLARSTAVYRGYPGHGRDAQLD
jgi:poly-gamma-glutamate synthesis protein (capsule biosynthesis protein)